VVLITANFKGQEFVRIGYYVNNEYDDLELRDNPPPEPNFNKLIRTIAADQPRVTKFKINWEPANASASASNTDVNGGTASSSLPDADMMAEESNNMAKLSVNGTFENKENLTKSEQNLFQLPLNSQSQSQQQPKFGSMDKSFINSTNSNLLFENSIDSVMN
jgi:hypothetical protein